ncbi:MAG: cytochrome C oxidase subunit IV family protein [Verrucomicrobia bacterium]|nr:cytochrome C oxidase subunit IV family protein [Verrucomicrobiota bacterium]MDA1004983.1 cytochrome C oxidase subunit IV family protein [Verrucomicrobiota bacterium]
MADSVEEIKKAQKLYILIGLVLFVFTVVTVAVATQPWLDFGAHGFDKADMTIGLLIATVKATLVGAIFMHLNHEKKLVYWVFGLGIIMGIALMLLTALSFADPIKYGNPKTGDGFYNPEIPEIN